jgi:hypothetical protein
MAGRRSTVDPFATADGVRWLVVRDRLSRSIRYSELPPRADLRAALAAERICVSIEHFEPSHTPLGHGSFHGAKQPGK